MVRRAGHGPAAERESALEDFCALYWEPLYGYARGRGLAPEDAQDAVQSFLVRLLREEILTRAEVERGRLRSFLLTALQNHLISAARRAQTQRRGGSAEQVPLEWHEAEAAWQELQRERPRGRSRAAQHRRALETGDG